MNTLHEVLQSPTSSPVLGFEEVPTEIVSILEPQEPSVAVQAITQKLRHFGEINQKSPEVVQAITETVKEVLDMIEAEANESEKKEIFAHFDTLLSLPHDASLEEHNVRLKMLIDYLNEIAGV